MFYIRKEIHRYFATSFISSDKGCPAFDKFYSHLHIPFSMTDIIILRYGNVENSEKHHSPITEISVGEVLS